MYSPKIYPEHIEKMYKIRCICMAMGEKITMVDMVSEALEKYLPTKLTEANKKAITAGIIVVPALLERR